MLAKSRGLATGPLLITLQIGKFRVGAIYTYIRNTYYISRKIHWQGLKYFVGDKLLL